MILLNGKTLSTQILTDLKNRVARLDSTITLGIIIVGDDPASLKYIALKQKAAESIGITVKVFALSSISSSADLISLINRLNADSEITGFFVQLPLPKNLDKKLILNSLSPLKDIDGLRDGSTYIPAVVRGILTLLDHYQISLTAKKVVIINDSSLIGRPLKKILDSRGANSILCNDQTVSLPIITNTADILISATGVKNLIGADHIKNGAVVVDVANGDVDFESVKDKCSYITPTFGGVGPMTVASLLSNLIK